MKKNDYGIGEVTHLTGVTIKQLRYWEEKNLIPKPERIVCGERAYRRYDEELLKLISTMKKLIDEGMTVSGASKKAQEIITDEEIKNMEVKNDA
ncbi:HTH-type transcription regulator domain-containing, MerR-type [Desulfonema limicola]|uniref:HTH-type transcription regulator domain-containing, MerR-type n=1 Tax=Desulfonema limicola TaxID=45656 RepID=A0A975GJ75_9BACT|nr:MerR family transcriptional regulator [Desulfonema limicola]QTA82708.1 HTH-type transcription regulator domain-containing, MerR-type [Desulfonema limicola]